jgi:membrane protease YdiL (CAAX protease family)
MDEEPSEPSAVEEKNSFFLSTSSKGLLFFLFMGIGFLVFTVGGYENFVPSGIRPLNRAIVFCILVVSTYVAKKSEKLQSYWRVLFSFTVSSAGLLAAWYLGQWIQIVPGLSISTIEGVAIAKVAEVLPIIVAIVLGVWIVEKDMTSVFLKGGNIKKGITLGLLVSPLGLIPFLALGGLGITVEANLIITWIPWIFAFSIANSLMEELMIRGLFLRKYVVFFGQSGSLLLTSVVFTLFHFAILANADFVLGSIFVVISFILGLVWGCITQKSDNIWGSVLAHMISDMFVILAVFGAI